MNKNTLSILNDLSKPEEMSAYEFIKQLNGEPDALCTQLILDALQGDIDATKLIIEILDGKEDTPEVQKELRRYTRKIERRICKKK